MDNELSKTAFDLTEMDRESSCRRLAEEITRRLHEVALRELEVIKDELSKIGHETQLSSDYDPEFAAWHCSVEHPVRDGKAPSLRFYYDPQVSCWYD